MESQTCKLCKNDFRKEVMKDGKCPLCVVEHPDCETREEMLSKVKMPNKMGDDLNETRVREIFREMFEEQKEVKRPVGRPKNTETK